MSDSKCEHKFVHVQSKYEFSDYLARVSGLEGVQTIIYCEKCGDVKQKIETPKH